MKKILLMLVVLSGITFSSFAQVKSIEGGNKFSVGLDIGIPTGTAATVFDVAVGPSLKYSYFLTKKVAVTGSVGYTAFIVDNELTAQGESTVHSYAPFKVGLKVYPVGNWYVQGEAGAVLYLSSGGSLSDYSGGVGYNFGTGVDVALRYESWESVQQVAVRLAYSF
jgi:hypothetical protein